MVDEIFGDHEALEAEQLANCECVCNACRRECVAIDELIYYAGNNKLNAVLDEIRQEERGSPDPITEDELFQLSGLLERFLQDRESGIWVAMSDEMPELIREAQKRVREGQPVSTGNSFFGLGTGCRRKDNRRIGEWAAAFNRLAAYRKDKR